MDASDVCDAHERKNVMERLGFPSRIEETRDAKYQRDTYTSRTVRKKKGVHLVLLCTVQLHTTNSIASATTCRTSRVRKLTA